MEKNEFMEMLEDMESYWELLRSDQKVEMALGMIRMLNKGELLELLRRSMELDGEDDKGDGNDSDNSNEEEMGESGGGMEEGIGDIRYIGICKVCGGGIGVEGREYIGEDRDRCNECEKGDMEVMDGTGL